MNDLQSDFEILTKAVRQAGHAALEFRARGVRVWRKPDGSAVTEADFAANDICETLLRQTRPGYGWLSEESRDGEARLAASRVWIIDPIDGTQAYLSGKDDWCISAALCENGAPLLAAIFNPQKNELFTAIRGQGARLNAIPLKIREGNRAGGLRLIAPRNQLRPHFWSGPLPPFEAKWANSIAYRLSLVAAGHADAAISLSAKSEWDLAAGVLIAGEAGCTVTDQLGNTPQFNNLKPSINGIIAAAPILHGFLLGLRKPKAALPEIDITNEQRS